MKQETPEDIFHQYQLKYKQKKHESELATKYSEQSLKTLMECRNIMNKLKPILEAKFAELFGLDYVIISYMADNMACFQFDYKDYYYEVLLIDCDFCDILSNNVRCEQKTYNKDIFYRLHKLNVGEEVLRDI